MKQQNVAMIAIDLQNDFMDIPTASLGVAGAVKDVERIAEVIKKVNPRKIFASQDTHYVLDISHTSWWNKADGTSVDPFTPISADEIKNGKFVARVDPIRSLAYVEALEAGKEFGHFIWTNHCIAGTPGHNFHPIFLDAISQWMVENKTWVNFIRKGENPFTEHFGIFRANVPDPKDPSSQVNQGLFQALNQFDNLILVGEARSHCVANSMKQLLEIAPQLASKLLVVEDCMSNVPGLPADFYVHVDNMYADAKSKGVQFVKSTDL